jgi:hypothetical protein
LPLLALFGRVTGSPRGVLSVGGYELTPPPPPPYSIAILGSYAEPFGSSHKHFRNVLIEGIMRSS